jgi:hypothetical protein
VVTFAGVGDAVFRFGGATGRDGTAARFVGTKLGLRMRTELPGTVGVEAAFRLAGARGGWAAAGVGVFLGAASVGFPFTGCGC